MGRKKFKGAVLKPTIKHVVGDDWMRPDFIIVSKDFSPKELKPYQRLIVLRKPTGEIRCIVDKSLSYSEIARMQQKIDQVGYIDVNSNEFTRIIPHDFKAASEKVFDIESNDEETKEVVNEIKQLLDDFQKNEYSMDSLAEEKQNIYISSLIKLKDDNISIHLNDKKKTDNNSHGQLSEAKSNISEDIFTDVNIIDSVKVHIPHEEQLITWEQDDMDEIQQFNEALLSNNHTDANYLQFSQQVMDEEIKEAEQEIEQEKVLYVGSEFDSSNENVVYHYDGSRDVNTEYKKYTDKYISVEDYDNDAYPYDLNTVDNQQEVVEENNETKQHILTEQEPNDYLVDGETTFSGANDYVEAAEQAPTIIQDSFFKNKSTPEALMYGKNKNQYYSFYVDSNNADYEKVYLNKKMNIYTFRKKIDKNLIASKNRKSLFGFFSKSK